MTQEKAKRDLTFGDVRDYASRIDRISICMAKTLEYENYTYMDEVPHTYDDLYLHGFGMIDSEEKRSDPVLWTHHLEFFLSDEPKEA